MRDISMFISLQTVAAEANKAVAPNASTFWSSLDA